MSKTVILDSGYWISLFNPNDHLEYQDLITKFEKIKNHHKILIPYPTLYEFLNSKFSRNHRTNKFHKELLKENIYSMIDDENYKEEALDNFLRNNAYQRGKQDISLVDEVIKLMIDDPNLKTDYIITLDKVLENYARSKGVQIPSL